MIDGLGNFTDDPQFETLLASFSGLVSRLDEIVCAQVLDRVEDRFPSVKKPTKEILGYAVDGALTVTEGCVGYILPEVKVSIKVFSVSLKIAMNYPQC